MSEVSKFSTYDVDLAAFLMLNGFKFIECVIDEPKSPKPRVLLKFFDEKNNARDLERIFMGSEIKKYREYHKYLLKSIHRCLKGID